MAYTVGIDIGSTCAKAVVLENGVLVCRLLQSTGWSSVDTAGELKEALTRAGYAPEEGTPWPPGMGGYPYLLQIKPLQRSPVMLVVLLLSMAFQSLPSLISVGRIPRSLP